MKKLLLILFVIIALINIKAQELPYKNYTINDGLLSSSINSICQDRQGYIWIGTKYGISKFDGYNFTNYTVKDGLMSNDIVDIYQDNTGRIWFLSSKFHITYIKNDIIHQYKYNERIQRELYSNSPYLINSFYVDEGKIKFAVKNRGVFVVYKNGNIKLFYNKELKTNHLVVSKTKNGTFLLKPKLISDTLSFIGNCSFTKSYFKYVTNKKLLKNIVVEVDKSFLYLALNKKIIIFKNKKLTDSLYIGDEISYMKKINNNLWLVTENKGVLIYKIDRRNGKLKYTNSVLKNVRIKSIIIDREGGYWLSSKYKGVFYIPELDVFTYKLLEDDSNDKITDIISFKGDVYAGTNSGVLININNNEFLQVAESVHFSEMKLATNDEKLIISYANKLYSTSDGKYFEEFFDVKAEDLDGFVIKTIEAKSNKILLSSNAGFLGLIDEHIKRIINPDRRFRLSINKTLMLPDKTILIASENGLLRYSNDDLFNYGIDNPMLNIGINDVFVEKASNDIFVATSGYGLLCLRGDSLINYQDNALSSDIIFSICNADSFMVISSNKGIDIVRIDGKKGLDIIQKYNKQYGLISNEIKKVICSKENIYSMSDKGINKIEISKFENKSVRPYIFIKRIHINDLDTIKYDNCKLSYNQNHISFEFIGLSYKNAGNIQYKFKLMGSKSDWVFSKSIKAEYPFLPPGKYRFIVYASNEDGKWSAVPDTFDFEILPPFWKAWWFIIIFILAILLIIFIVVRFVIIDIKRKEKLKKDLYMYRQQALRKQMNPHFIFNALNSIQHYILQNDKRMSNKYLNKFSSLMRIVLENSQKNLITIERELSALELYLDIESIRFKDKFEYKINVDLNIDKGIFKIPPLLLQPYAENAIWHGIMNLEKDEIGRLNINIKLIDNLLHCYIIDNGVGREKSRELLSRKNRSYQSLGTEINKNRIDAFNYKGETNILINYIDLKDENGHALGTKVIVIIPIIK